LRDVSLARFRCAAHLIDANLFLAFLTRANLNGANLERADLRFANWQISAATPQDPLPDLAHLSAQPPG
jgi:uncharacterized protein YjbI with pentapeptide repeats